MKLKELLNVEKEKKILSEVISLRKGKQLNKDLTSKVKSEDFPYPLINGGVKPSG